MGTCYHCDAKPGAAHMRDCPSDGRNPWAGDAAPRPAGERIVVATAGSSDPMRCPCGAEFTSLQDFSAHYNAARFDDSCRRYAVSLSPTTRCGALHGSAGRTCDRFSGHDGQHISGALRWGA